METSYAALIASGVGCFCHNPAQQRKTIFRFSYVRLYSTPDKDPSHFMDVRAELTKKISRLLQPRSQSAAIGRVQGRS